MSGRTEAELLRWLRDNVADLLDLDVDEIDPDRPLTELGISSRDAVGLVGELEDYLDRDLDATLVWQTPTISALARLLAAGADLKVTTATVQVDADESQVAAPAGHDGREPVAIIGLGVRFPGDSDGPEKFWSLLSQGRDAVSSVPDGRWDDFTSSAPSSQAAVARVNRAGGFLSDVAGFDAEYFGITPHEASLMDPQQRMLLEVFVEAVEHAGLDLDRLRGSDTGVYVGMSTNEYSHLAANDLAEIDAYMATGSAFSIAANRISYLYDLRGPSITLDTACSSSLVAIHQATRAIREGDIDTAFVAGVNLLLSPATTMTFGQAGALAPQGGCKPFSDDADGIARAEGAGVVVLKKLSTALADGDRVLAVVAGSAVNQDGRSNGLTAPNPLAQEACLVKAYADAGLPVASVDYVEAHGTGTLLGDPIEAAALGAALGAGRSDDAPLLIGSVKSNLGHPESAAGIAGVIKVVLAMQHDVIPPSIKYHGPNPHIRFADWKLRVASAPTKWPRHSGRAVAGVSGFGFGGTNAHVVLAEYIAPVGPETVPETGLDDAAPITLALSGVSAARTRSTAERLAEWLEAEGSGVPLGAVASTLARRRTRAAATSVVSARGRGELVDVLRTFAVEQRPAGKSVVVRSVPRTDHLHPGTDRAVWVFSGFGQAWPGMGRGLLTDEPAFAATIAEMDPLFVEHAGFSLRAVIAGDAPMDGLATVQIATFGVQVALAALWRSYGVEPAAVIGHSVGEVAAAVVAGGLSLADGIRIISVRSWLQEEGNRTGTGSMAVLEITTDELAELHDRFPGVVVCVYSSTTMLTVGSADADELAGLVAHVEGLNRTAWPLPVRGAGHSHMVEPYLPRFLEQLGDVQGRIPSVPFYSTALADPRETPTFDQHYWATNARRPVRFTQVVQLLAADGHAAFLEVSAHPVAGVPLRQSVEKIVGPGLLVLPTLRRDGDDQALFRSSALALHRAGLAVDLDQVVPVAPQADLPAPVWKHRRYWVEPTTPSVPTVAFDGHPLLGVHVELPEGDRHLWRSDIGTAALPWVDHHRVFDIPVLPASAYAEMALAAAREVLAPDRGPDAVRLTDLDLETMMSLGEHTDVTTSLTLADSGLARVEIWSRSSGSPVNSPMVRNASATVRLTGANGPAGAAGPAGQAGQAGQGSRTGDDVETADDLVLDLAALETARPVDLYAVMRAAGHEYGPSFLGVSEARLADNGVATAQVALPEVARFHAVGAGYTVHPVLLDVCMQTLAVSALSLADQAERIAEAGMFTPVGVGSVRVLAELDGPAVEGALATARIRLETEAEAAADRLVGAVRVVSADGLPLIEIRDVTLRRIAVGEVVVPLPVLLHDARWVEAAVPSGQGARENLGSWLLVEAEPGAGAQLRSELESAGHRVLAPLDPVRLDLGLSRLDDEPGLPPAGVLVAAPAWHDDDAGVGDEPGLRLPGRLAELTMAVRAAAGSVPRVWVVTRNGAALLDGERGNPALSAQRGLVRVAARELDGVPVSLLDVDDLSAVVRELSAPVAAADDEIAWRDGARRVRRLQKVGLASAGTDRGAARGTGPWQPRAGGYLLTGPLNGTATAVLGWLVGRLDRVGGSSRIVLSGAPVHLRTGSDAGVDVAAAVAALSARSSTCTVELLPLDVELAGVPDADAVKAQVAAVTCGGLPLRGVIQLPAGALAADTALQAAWLLHEVAAEDPQELDVWCLAGDDTTLFGRPGEARSAVRGAWLEGLVGWRRAQGLNASMIRWGDTGSGSTGSIGTDLVCEAIAGLSSGGEVLGVARPVSGLPATGYFHDLAPSESALDDGWPGPARLLAMVSGDARQLLADRLRGRVAWVMGYRPEDVDAHVPLSSLGVDSLIAMRAKNAVEQDTDVVIPVRLMLQGASLADLEQYIAAELGIADGAVPAHQIGPRSHRDVEARDGVERWLVSTWQGVTGVMPSGVTAPLSELGHEAHAYAVADLVLERLVSAPGARTVQVPTRAELVAAADIEAQSELVRPIIEHVGDSPVRVLAPGELGVRPLFLFHPAGGTTSVYHPLVSQLGDDVPVYGLDRLGGLNDIDEKVTTYLALIHQLQPEGPYRLGGWSFGGALAYRTAQRLRADGEEVETVFMIDTIMPEQDDQTEQELLTGRFERFLEYLNATYGVQIEIDLDWLVSLPEHEQIDTLTRLVTEAGASLSPAVMEHQRTSYEDARMAERYTPTDYGPGRVVLYRSTERGLTTTIDPRYARTEDTLGWDEFVADLEVVLVPGNHTSIIDRPQVDTMAAHLSHALSEVAPHVG